MSLEVRDVQAIATALQALLPAAPAAPPAAVASVSIKLPPFWATRPEVWFRQVEAQFATRSPPITADLTKFNYVIAALDNATAGEVEAIILSPPTDGKYDALKTALIGAFGKTQASKDMELLSLSGLGDRKPSSLLRHMESLNADPKTLLRALFLAQLPLEARRILAGSLTADLKDLAREADAIMEAGSTGFGATGISAVHKPTSSPPNLTPKELCFYHTKFGKEARKCNQRGCKMAHLISSSAPTLSTPSPASGNGQAGR
jgi:hypothetical protein